jgi:predicted ATPase
MRVATSRGSAPLSEPPVAAAPSGETEGGLPHGAWRVEMLGRLRLVRGTQTVSRFRTQKTGALLAYLAYHAERSHPRELLADNFWPDAAPDSARHSLRLALSDLRRLLDTEESASTSAGVVIVADRNHVELRPGAIQTDVAAFERTLNRLSQTHIPDEKRRLLEAAVELYSGPLLPGVYEPWVTPQQLRLEDRYLEAVLELIAILEGAGELSAALRRAHQAATVVPDCHDITEAQIRLQRAITPAKPGYGTVVSRPEPAPALPPQDPRLLLASGTFTLLAVEGESAALNLLARQQKGAVLRTEPAPCLLAFPRVQEAWAVLEALQAKGKLTRAALHTSETPAGKADASEEAPLRFVEALLRATPPGICVCTETTASLLRTLFPDPARLVSLGAYALRGPASADRVFRISVSGALVEAVALQAPRTAETTLPLPLTRFFGREADLTALMSLLSTNACRLLTLVGPGGIGKTRLSLEVGHRLADEYAAGMRCFVSLADSSDTLRAWDAIRRALGLPPPGPGLAPRDQIVDALRSHPCALLLLDNAEHLLDNFADNISLVIAELLDAVPTLTCLVTSRRPLGVLGEREFPLAPLPLPEPMQESAEAPLPDTPAVALFVDRATAARPDFRLTARNARAVVELCRQLEGLPLSLELAAARVSTLSPAQMLGQIGDRLDLLTRRRQGGVSRHRSLRAAVQWSYDLLTSEQKSAFAQLAVFRGGWDADAAAAVWNVSRIQAHDLLEDLCHHSLIFAEERGEQMRYRMLETLRSFAEEQLDSEERVGLGRRHARHFLTQAEAVRRAIDIPVLPRPAILAMDAAMEAEYDNVHAALAFCLAGTDEDRQLGLSLAVSMTPRWYWRAHLATGQHWLEALLEACVASNLALPEPLEGAARMSLGLFYRIIGYASEARREFKQALELLERYPDDEYLPWCHHSLAVSRLDYGAYDEMEHHNRTAEDIWRQRGHAPNVALSRCHEGLMHYGKGDTRLAEAAILEADSLLRASGAELYLGMNLGILGCIRNDQARHEEAIACYEEAAASFRQNNMGQFLAFTLRDEGEAHLRRGNYDTALIRAEEAELLFRQTGGRYGVSTARLWRAQAHLYRNAPGDREQGEALLALIEADAAEGIGPNLLNYVDMTRAVVTMREATAPSEVQAVVPILQALLGRFLERNLRSSAAYCLAYLAEAYYGLGNRENAASLLRAADMLREVLGSPPPENERAGLDRLRANLADIAPGDEAADWQAIARAEADTQTP